MTVCTFFLHTISNIIRCVSGKRYRQPKSCSFSLEFKPQPLQISMFWQRSRQPRPLRGLDVPLLFKGITVGFLASGHHILSAPRFHREFQALQRTLKTKREFQAGRMEMLLSVDMYCMLLQWEKRGIGIKRGYNGIYYKKIGQQIPSKVRRLGQLKCQQSRAPGLGLACPKMWKAQIVKPHIPILGGKIQLLVGSKYLQSQ